MTPVSRGALRAGLWLAVAIATTVALIPLRARLDPTHVALLYLLVVLGGSVRGGRPTGIALALLTSAAFNYFFLPPYFTLRLSNPLDGVVLVTYLVTALVAAHLLSRAEREAAERLRLAAEADHARALREADRMKDALLAAVSHDLRTPLTTIRALAHDIAATGDERATILAEESDRMSRLVTDLLDLSRLKAGAVRPVVEINAIEDLVGAAIQQVSGALGGRELKAGIDTRDALLLGRFDFVHTLRIVVNLVDNAHKYSPPGAPVEVSARRDGARVLISVADRGPGVPEPERERIFQPFQRGAGVPTSAGGAGLGLAIAAGLAEAQGATLRYLARSGGGSVFELAVPAAELPELHVVTGAAAAS